jgi:uncharacterized membrane protein YfcA
VSGADRGTIGVMISTFREMPGGVRLFLAYAFLILALIGITLPAVVNLATGDAPISGFGLVAVLLLAYTIFTITLVLQRKQAAWAFSQGLATLTIPLVPFLGLAAGLAGAIFAGALALLLFRGLRSARARSWFSEI